MATTLQQKLRRLRPRKLGRKPNRRKRCYTKRCRNPRAWNQSRCYSCLRLRYSSRKELRKQKRKRPGSAPSRAGWQKARAAVSGGSCAICGAPGGKPGTHPIDHIIAARFIQRHELGDANSSENLVVLCASCHPKKRKAENRLCNRTNIVGWLQELNRIGFPMERVEKALEAYGMG